MAGTVSISRAPGACRFSTYGGPASDLPLISNVHGVVASGSRLGEQSQAQVTRTQRYIQGDTRQAGMASVPSPEKFKSLDLRMSTIKLIKGLELYQTKSSQCGQHATTEEFREIKKEMDDERCYIPRQMVPRLRMGNPSSYISTERPPDHAAIMTTFATTTELLPQDTQGKRRKALVVLS
jgi:hypothetical protein